MLTYLCSLLAYFPLTYVNVFGVNLAFSTGLYWYLNWHNNVDYYCINTGNTGIKSGKSAGSAISFVWLQ